MPPLVVNGATLQCTFGMTPSSLIVPPVSQVMAQNSPAATITDAVPMANIMPFGMCTTLTNPQVAAATSAAMGTLTPQPCIPVTSVWTPGSPKVTVRNQPAVDSTCTCMCAWGGQISVINPGQMTVQD
jgi:hypothetical protein